MKKAIKDSLIYILNKLPYIRGLYSDNCKLRENIWVSPGHYYSPIISINEVKNCQDKIWEKENDNEIIGINLNTQYQLDLVSNLYKYYDEIPFSKSKEIGLRYHFENRFFDYIDAIFLYSMIRQLNPNNIVEIGSGYSSCVMLDTNQLFFNNNIKLTFIEPYTERLNSLLRSDDKKSVRIIQSKVQKVHCSEFEKLSKGDILFIDSSHVVKTGSDVNYLLFEILPILKKGVFIHFHDIFYPFEYPKKWVFEGRSWNEDYFLKAFLMYNSEFEIKLFSNYLQKIHGYIFDRMPLCHSKQGGSLWIEKK